MGKLYCVTPIQYDGRYIGNTITLSTSWALSDLHAEVAMVARLLQVLNVLR